MKLQDFTKEELIKAIERCSTRKDLKTQIIYNAKTIKLNQLEKECDVLQEQQQIKTTEYLKKLNEMQSKKSKDKLYAAGNSLYWEDYKILANLEEQIRIFESLEHKKWQEIEKIHKGEI